MRQINYILMTVWQTLLRMFPFPCRTGLIQIGNPDRNAPVFLTCNFRLTVERVRRQLEGIDSYLLVANSRGVNVWCAATGGLFTDHDVVSVLKTSGIEGLVDHRRVVLPQLAATGIEAKVVHQRSGWRVVWGPVYASSIPAFLADGMEKTEAMRTVRFPWQQRLEMAVAWAFPISFLSLLVIPFWREGVIPLIALIWSWSFLLRWRLSSLIILLIVGLDLTGSTPVYKSGLHDDRAMQIELDAELCKGAGLCQDVCPTNVFAIDHRQKLARLPGKERCVQCGACIVQCPFDALHFQNPTGERVEPGTVRRFKLNLMGSRRRRP